MTDVPDKLEGLRPPACSEQGLAEAEYLKSKCVELAAMAEKANFGRLARLLGVAVTEAYLVAERHRGKVSQDESAAAEP